ncbi:MAG: hypothetical protein DHS20C07_22460 [Methyloligella sp.]|nr:MAG: hypothetical protein DHS20C07_22460 [Methyloligella sp.]
MGYDSQNNLSVGTKLRPVLETVELLGYKPIKDNLSVPNRVGCYFWYDEKDYKSWSGVNLDVYKNEGLITIEIGSRISGSYWDLTHQNKTLRLMRDLFGGHFSTSFGRNRYWRLDDPPPSPVSSGCYLARWHFHNAQAKAHIYLMTRKLEGEITREKSTGLEFMDEMNPRLLSNNLLIPYVIAIWEEYFRSTFAVAIKYVDNRDSVLKKIRLNNAQLKQIAEKQKPIEQIISECFSFQRPSLITQNFKMLDNNIDIAAALRKPYRSRKLTLYDSIEALVEGRNDFVHTGKMDLTLYDRELERHLVDIVEAIDRAYGVMGSCFDFIPIHDY